MQITVTNINPANPTLFLRDLYTDLAYGHSVTTRRATAELNRATGLQADLLAGNISISYLMEAIDTAQFRSGPPPVSYSDITRPAANLFAPFTFIWNTSGNAYNFSDGVQWRDSMGVPT